MRSHGVVVSLVLAAAVATGVACGGSSDDALFGAPPASSSSASSSAPSSSTSASSTATASSSPGVDSGAPPTAPLKTVFLVMMENHGWATVHASPSSTFINGPMTTLGAHAEAYSTPPGNHPSEPNYIWLEAGDNLGIADDAAPAKNHRSTKEHLTAQLEAAGISWKAYAEGIDADTCPLTTADGTHFDPKHTPQLYFDDVTDTNQPTSKHCVDHVRPFAELAQDLAKDQVARYNFITPNLCNDMHGETSLACPVIGNDDGLIKLGNDWLAAEIPKIQASKAYEDGGVIFVAWDEGDEPLFGDASDGPIPLFVLSPKARAGFASSTPHTHSSLLRTVQTIFGVTPYLRGAATSNDLSEMFTSFP